MMSDNTQQFRYMSHDFMSNMSHKFGDFDLNLLLGATMDETKTDRSSMMAWNFPFLISSHTPMPVKTISNSHMQLLRNVW